MLLLRCICGGENAAEATGFLSFLHLALLTGGTNISRLYRSSRTQKRRISLAIMSLANRLAFNRFICIKLSRTQLLAAPPLFEWPHHLPKVYCGSVNHALPLSIGNHWALRGAVGFAAIMDTYR